MLLLLDNTYDGCARQRSEERLTLPTKVAIKEARLRIERIEVKYLFLRLSLVFISEKIHYSPK